MLAIFHILTQRERSDTHGVDSLRFNATLSTGSCVMSHSLPSCLLPYNAWLATLNKHAVDLFGQPSEGDRKKRRTRRIKGMTYSSSELPIIAMELDKFEKLILVVSINCGMQPAESGRLEVDDYFQVHPETGVQGDWIIFDRPKTLEYGEWILWPEVACLPSPMITSTLLTMANSAAMRLNSECPFLLECSQ